MTTLPSPPVWRTGMGWRVTLDLGRYAEAFTLTDTAGRLLAEAPVLDTDLTVIEVFCDTDVDDAWARRLIGAYRTRVGVPALAQTLLGYYAHQVTFWAAQVGLGTHEDQMAAAQHLRYAQLKLAVESVTDPERRRVARLLRPSWAGTTTELLDTAAAVLADAG